MAGEHKAQDRQFLNKHGLGHTLLTRFDRLQEPNIPLFFNYLETYAARE